jgi:hypothetical protein
MVSVGQIIEHLFDYNEIVPKTVLDLGHSGMKTRRHRRAEPVRLREVLKSGLRRSTNEMLESNGLIPGRQVLLLDISIGRLSDSLHLLPKLLAVGVGGIAHRLGEPLEESSNRLYAG